MSPKREPPPVPFGAFAAVAAAGMLLLAFFIARSGSVVALVVALGVAAGFSAVAVGLWRRGRARRRTAAEPAEPRSFERLQPAVKAQAMPDDSVASDRIVSALTHQAVRNFEAPASAVLVIQGSHLVSAGSAGDWALARQLMGEAESPGVVHSTAGSEEPPVFPLDPRNDWLQRFLGLYHRPIPMERWKELSDAPPPLVPLVGLAASAVGVAVPLTYRRRLYGLWILAQRPGQRHYTDIELASLERLAQEHGQQLGSALTSHGR